jgi:hypothetical protein
MSPCDVSPIPRSWSISDGVIQTGPYAGYTKQEPSPCYAYYTAAAETSLELFYSRKGWNADPSGTDAWLDTKMGVACAGSGWTNDSYGQGMILYITQYPSPFQPGNRWFGLSILRKA